MNKYYSILLVLLIGCSGSDSEQYIPPAGEVAITTDSRGCVTGHNADLVTGYLVGDKQARNLTWSCLSDDTSLEVFQEYDYVDQCFRSAGNHPGRCYEPEKPTTPLYQVNIHTFTGNLYHAGSGTYALSHVERVQNVGNVGTYNVRWELKRGSDQVLDDGVFGYISPKEFLNIETTPVSPDPYLFTDITPGQDVSFTFTVYDNYGVQLDSRTLYFTAE